jgi:hypothetical protein
MKKKDQGATGGTREDLPQKLIGARCRLRAQLVRR